jgi:Fe-S cluster assembly protein SufD
MIATTQFMRRELTPEIPEGLLSAFEAIPENPTASALRFAAWQAFANRGIPQTSDEEYSFTSISEIKNLLSRIPGNHSGNGFAVTNADRLEQFPLTSSSTPEAMVSAWKKIASEEKDVASALAMALTPQSIALRLKAGKKLETPFPIVCKAKGSRTDAAMYLQLDAGSTAKISLASEVVREDYLNASASFYLGEKAELDLAQIDPIAGSQTLKLHFVLERGAKLRLLTASTGGRFQRLAIEVDLMGSDAEVDLRGAAVVGGVNRCHRHVVVRHHVPDCISRQLFKAVVLGSGRSSVDGTVIVDRGAQRTDAKQLLRHLMLSKEGKADSKPRLFIHADDVKCGHGATVGKMDPEQLFYLRSRGLDPEAAISLLTHAFLAEALDASALTDFREAARLRLLAALEETP